MAIKIKWSEDKVQKMLAEGRGAGELATYIPWIKTREFNSKGVATELPSPRYERLINLMSEGELKLFILIEWHLKYWDCREQYPLNRELAIKVAKTIGIDYANFPNTSVPAVYSVDFLAVEKIDGHDVYHAFDMKDKDEELEKEGVIRNLELSRAYWEALGVKHTIVTKKTLPLQYCDNIYRIRKANPDLLDSVEASFFEGLRSRVLIGLQSMTKSLSVENTMSRMDVHFNITPGSSLRAFEQLVFLRKIDFDMKAADYLYVKIGDIQEA